MKTISHYRQEAVNKKSKSALLITLAVTFAFVLGVLVGNTTHIVQDLMTAGGRGVDVFSGFYHESAAPAVLHLAERFNNIAGIFLAGLAQDSEYIFMGP